MDGMKIKGLRQLERAMRKLPGKVAVKVARGATLSGANIIKKEAKLRAPIRTVGTYKKRGSGKNVSYISWPGNLSESIIARQNKKGSGFIQYGVGTNDKGFYGHMVEFGTEHSAPHPFMRPAFDAKKQDAVKKIEQRLWAGLKRENMKLRR